MQNQNVLQHHGILGMKWGIRRYQNPDGSYTDEGRRRRGISLFRQRSKPAVKYQINRSRSAREIAISNYRKQKAKKIAGKILIATGAVAAVSLVAYTAYKRGRQAGDEILAAGNSVYRVEGGAPNNIVPKMFYATNNKGDASTYIGTYSPLLALFNKGKSHSKKITANSTINVAGNKTGKQIFTQLYKQDSEFRKFANRTADKNRAWKILANKNKIRNSNDMSRMYQNFNINMVKKEYRNGSSVNKFIDALKKRGYNGIKDVNDQRFSGLNTRNPMIFFDVSDKMSVTSADNIPVSEMAYELTNYNLRKLGGTSLKAASVGGIAGGSALLVSSKKNKKKKKRRY